MISLARADHSSVCSLMQTYPWTVTPSPALRSWSKQAWPSLGLSWVSLAYYRNLDRFDDAWIVSPVHRVALAELDLSKLLQASHLPANE